MSTMIMAEETPTRLVLKSDKPEDYGGGCITVAIVGAMVMIIILAYARYAFFESSRTWLFWVIAVATLLIESLLVYVAIKTSPGKNIQEATVSIDIESQKATRIEKLKSGKVKQYDLEFVNLKQVVFRSEEVGHGVYLLLEPYDGSDFSIASGEFVGHFASLMNLSKKLGDFLRKPVVLRNTDGGKLTSEEIIQA